MNDANRRILIVEDEPLLLNLYAKKMINAGYKVFTAVNGEEGFRKAKDCQPDLILMDILMPRMNGYEMLRLMRKEEKTKSIPAIIMTNSPSLPNAWEARTLGIVKSFFKTNVTPAELAAYIMSYFRSLRR
jgi:CheY-like chemotaxis protein